MSTVPFQPSAQAAPEKIRNWEQRFQDAGGLEASSRTDLSAPWISGHAHLLDVPARDEPIEVGGVPKMQLAFFRAEGHLSTWYDRQSPHIDGRIRPNDFLISPASLVGKSLTSYVSRRTQGTDIFFEPALIAKACRACDLDPDAPAFSITSTHPSTARAGGRVVDPDPMVEQLAWSLSDELAAGAPNGRIYAEQLLLTLAVHLLTEYASIETSTENVTGGIPPIRLQRVKDYIEEHLNENLTLKDLAEQAQMSEYHFTRQFKAEEGIPPYEYVIQRRVKRAQDLLRDTDASVADVARRVGYTTRRPLVRQFKKHVGTTPGQYREVMS